MAQAIDRLKGTVRWFNARRGFGFITPEDGVEDLFVHHSSIKAAGFRCLVEGEFVEFSVDVGDDGRTRAAGVTVLGGASVQCASYGSVGQRGLCYSCGEVGHLARNCFLRNGGLRNWAASEQFSEKRRSLILTDEEDEVEEDEVEKDEVEEDVEELPAGAQRNWAELPRDVLSLIFKKIAAIEIISSAQFVCKPWRHLSHEPELWRCIDMTGHADLSFDFDMNTLAMEAVLRSSGCLEEFHGEYVGNDELMDFMAKRATLLRCLHLDAAHEMTDEGLAEALKKFPLLEELELTLCSFSDEVVELVGPACPHLKTFRLNGYPYIVYDDFESDSELNSEALAIAKHMQQLRCLQLISNTLTNDGLTAILDNCPYLQHLDIRKCLHVNPDENLKKKLARIKVLRLPNDSTADCPFDTTPERDYADPNRCDSECGFEYGNYGYYGFDEYPDMGYDGFLGDVLWGGGVIL